MRLAFPGTPEAAAPTLQALVDAGHDVALVVTRPDRRRGRGAALSNSPVHETARGMGRDVAPPLGDLAAAAVERGVVVAYGALVPAEVLARIPMLNVHFSLLPRWRGAAPVERAILAGDVETGVSVMTLEATLDTGPVHLTRREAPGRGLPPDPGDVAERVLAHGASGARLHRCRVATPARRARSRGGGSRRRGGRGRRGGRRRGTGPRGGSRRPRRGRARGGTLRGRRRVVARRAPRRARRAVGLRPGVGP